ncbi:hypothetical protein [Flavobacterium kingsejongi]|uniref:hypothetical protein n=1 Tax=Flavobacterium kingsejongi TaxID=1678728 RepID=UPI0013007EC1|nr:hypothetical protein [Flavobacterium kingsejongi]
MIFSHFTLETAHTTTISKIFFGFQNGMMCCCGVLKNCCSTSTSYITTTAQNGCMELS